MISKNFSIGKKINNVLQNFPSLRFRDRDVCIHDASGVIKCGRALSYKALGVEQSNPIDNLGHFRMRFGSWIERGIQYELMSKLPMLGIVTLSTQGSAGEHGTFYGTSWHGFRDYDMGFAQVKQDGSTSYKPVIIELKTKVGIGANFMIKKTAWSKFYKDEILPDTEWGYAQQLGLYLRDAYIKTKDNSKFSQPITDGILLYFLYVDKLAVFLEFYAEYKPETDSTHYYRLHCEQIPEICKDIDLTVNLKDIADNWAKQDVYLKAGKLAPPDYCRKYDVTDERIEDEPEYKLKMAVKNEVVLGDTHCQYCEYKDRCSQDLKLDLKYKASEVKILRSYLTRETKKKGREYAKKKNQK